MTRTRTSAKAAGSRFERVVAEYLAATVDDRIERRRLTGSRDRGDIAAVRAHGKRVVVEVKNRARVDIAGALTEAETARGNDDALAGVVVHKRHGNARPADQLVTMTLADFAALLAGVRAEV